MTRLMEAPQFVIARLGPSPIAEDALDILRSLFEGLRSTLLELGVPIDSFQGFGEEIDNLPYKYDESLGGTLLLGLEVNEEAKFTVFDHDSGEKYIGDPVACIAFKALPSAGDGVAEIKRLYVSPACRGKRYGRVMTERLTDVARRAGYKRFVLDTLHRLPAALKLYRSMGFVDVEPYVFNPMEDVVYLGKEL